MLSKVTRIDSAPKHRLVDPAGRDTIVPDRRAAYREIYHPSTPVEEALVDALAAIQDRRRELILKTLICLEDELLQDAFHSTLKTLRKLQRLGACYRGPRDPQKAA